MGVAICGMHYTGMSSTIFTPKAILPTDFLIGIDPQLLGAFIAMGVFIILGIAFSVSTYKELRNQQAVNSARDAGKAEVATSVLHNVGNVLNSINISLGVMTDQISNSELSSLQDVGNLINQNKDKLAAFFSNDPKGIRLPDYLIMLSQYREEEQKIISAEMKQIIEHVQHIKNIINTQQSTAASSLFEEIVEINSVIDESLAMSGVDFNKYCD